MEGVCACYWGSMYVGERVNPIFSSVLSRNSKLLVIAQLHPRSTEHLMSNIHLHHYPTCIRSAHASPDATPVHSNLESHILYTPPTTITTTMDHRCCSNGDQAGLHHVSFWLRTSEKDVLDWGVHDIIRGGSIVAVYIDASSVSSLFMSVPRSSSASSHSCGMMRSSCHMKRGVRHMTGSS